MREKDTVDIESERQKNVKIMQERLDVLVEFYNVKPLVDNGKMFIGRERSTDILGKLPIKPELKACYYNSQRLALIRVDLRYFEGYVVSDTGFAFEHAFNVTKDNKVVDVTLELADNFFDRHTDYGKATVYFGMEIPMSFIRDEKNKKLVKEGSYLLIFYLLELERKRLKDLNKK